MSALIIRPVEPADRQQWAALWKAYLAFYKSTLPDEIYQSTWTRFFVDDPYEPNAFVAERDGILIGLVHFMAHRHCWKTDNVIYLQDLFVSEAARGTGAGRALIEKVYEQADSSGTPTVYWMTQDFNATARHLYDQVATLTPFIKYQR